MLTARQRKLILLVFWLSIYRNILLAVGSKQAFSEQFCKKHNVGAVVTVEKIAISKDIALAISVVNKYIPWKNVCRHQSWQAVYLLLKYQIPFDYFVGIDKNKSKKEGHSWVKVNSKFICGRCKENSYTVILSVNF